MRYIFLLFIFISSISFAQQIPNPGFESWFVETWQEAPEDWQTPNGQLIPIVTKDTDAYEGDYAMKVTAVNDGIGASGWSKCFIPTSFIPSSLDFYVKASTQMGSVSVGSVSVKISFFNNENEFYTETWSSNESIGDWSLISLPLNQIEPAMTHAEIEVEAFASDLAPETVWISIDAMGFDGPLSSKSNQAIDFEIYPNPTTSNTTISGEISGSQLSLFDLTGKLLEKIQINSDVHEVNLVDFPKGIYLMEISSRSGARSSQKLVKK